MDFGFPRSNHQTSSRRFRKSITSHGTGLTVSDAECFLANRDNVNIVCHSAQLKFTTNSTPVKIIYTHPALLMLVARAKYIGKKRTNQPIPMHFPGSVVVRLPSFDPMAVS